jgi:hypothetical protein
VPRHCSFFRRRLILKIGSLAQTVPFNWRSAVVGVVPISVAVAVAAVLRLRAGAAAVDPVSAVVVAAAAGLCRRGVVRRLVVRLRVRVTAGISIAGRHSSVEAAITPGHELATGTVTVTSAGMAGTIRGDRVSRSGSSMATIMATASG